MNLGRQRVQSRRQVQSLLRQLFQYDCADLDFGLYRILREKREDIERFIEHDLLDAVEEGLTQFRATARQQRQASATLFCAPTVLSPMTAERSGLPSPSNTVLSPRRRNPTRRLRRSAEQKQPAQDPGSLLRL